jgi:hypothetical protein
MITSSVIACILGESANVRLAVKRRQQQLALSQMTRAVGRQHRVRADDRTQRRLGGQRRHERWLCREQRAHVIRVIRQHDTAWDDDEANAEHVAQLALRAEHKLDLTLRETQRLQRLRQRNRRRCAQRLVELGRTRRRRLGLADVKHQALTLSFCLACDTESTVADFDRGYELRRLSGLAL